MSIPRISSSSATSAHHSHGVISHNDGGAQSSSSPNQVSAVELERSRRQHASQSQQQRLQQKRTAEYEREEKRWSGMEAQSRAEEARIERKRQEGLASGTTLQHSDNLIKYRSALRTHHLYQKQNSEYNPVTGEKNREVRKPERPIAERSRQQ